MQEKEIFFAKKLPYGYIKLEKTTIRKKQTAYFRGLL